jgi:hypothetical protein
VRARTLVLATAVVLAFFAYGRYLGDDRREVIVLRTRDEIGVAYESEMWVVDLGAATWVRADDARRAWYRRLLANPQAWLVRGGSTRPVTGFPDESAETRALVDAAFREKYGWIDRWYGIVLRRDPVPIRLVPAD